MHCAGGPVESSRDRVRDDSVLAAALAEALSAGVHSNDRGAAAAAERTAPRRATLLLLSAVRLPALQNGLLHRRLEDAPRRAARDTLSTLTTHQPNEPQRTHD